MIYISILDIFFLSKWSVLLAKKSVLELTIETTELFNVIKEYIFPRPQGNGQEIPQGIAAGTKACGSGIYCLAGTTLSNIVSLVNSKCLEMIDYVNKGQLPGNQNNFYQKVGLTSYGIREHPFKKGK